MSDIDSTNAGVNVEMNQDAIDILKSILAMNRIIVEALSHPLFVIKTDHEPQVKP